MKERPDPRKIPLITTLQSVPVVGEWYAVPCVRFKTCFGFKEIPVLSNRPHNDAEHQFGDFDHYHYDLRFLSRKFYKFLIHKANYQSGIGWLGPMYPQFYGIRAKETEAPILYSRRCIRPMPKFPAAEMTRTLECSNKFAKKLRVSSTCIKCPHRGTPLQNLPKNGSMVVCPAHGLRWDMQTLEMAKK